MQENQSNKEPQALQELQTQDMNLASSMKQTETINLVESVEVEEEKSKLKFLNSKRNLMVIGGMGLGLLFIGYSLIASVLLPHKKEVVIPPSVQDSSPVGSSNVPSFSIDVPAIPAVPTPPQLVEPVVPSAPVADTQLTSSNQTDPALPIQMPQTGIPATPLPVASATSSSDNAQNSNISSDTLPIFNGQQNTGVQDSAAQRAEAKRKSSIILVGGGGGGSGTGDDTGTQNVTNNTKSTNATSDFTNRGDLNYVLGQGKILDVVLETAINSDYPSEIRALVSQDVYSENSKTILIPKGTRIFGSATISAQDNTGRVNIVWNKINFKSGYSLTLASNTVDNLGRGGMQGKIDNKYPEQILSAAFTSVFNLAIGAGIDYFVSPQNSVTSTTNMSSIIANIITIAYQIATSPTTSSNKIGLICAQLQLITDLTSPAYTAFSGACTTATQGLTTTGSNPDTLLTSLLSRVVGLNLLANNAVTTASTSQLQKAGQQAYQDFSNTVKGMVGKQQFTPTVTLPQGTKVKVYVNKDYTFPKEAISKSGVIN